MSHPRSQPFNEWLEANPAPDLQALVAKYGGSYLDVPQDVWDQFSKDVDAWRDKLRNRDRVV